MYTIGVCCKGSQVWFQHVAQQSILLRLTAGIGNESLDHEGTFEIFAHSLEILDPTKNRKPILCICDSSWLDQCLNEIVGVDICQKEVDWVLSKKLAHYHLLELLGLWWLGIVRALFDQPLQEFGAVIGWGEIFESVFAHKLPGIFG